MNTPETQSKRVLMAVCLLLLAWLPGAGCSLLFAPESGVTSDGGMQPSGDGSTSDDGGGNINDRLRPYQCDEDTQLLFHFDGEGWNSDACSPCGVTETSTTQASNGPSAAFQEARNFRNGAFLTANSDCLTALDTFTVEAWIRPDLLGSRDYFVAVRELDPQGVKHWRIQVTANRTIMATHAGSGCSGAGGESLESVTQLITGRWYHVRYVFDGEFHYLNLDGETERSARLIDPQTCQSEVMNVTIGAREDGTEEFIGAIDEFRYSGTSRRP